MTTSGAKKEGKSNKEKRKRRIRRLGKFSSITRTHTNKYINDNVKSSLSYVILSIMVCILILTQRFTYVSLICHTCHPAHK